MKDFERHVDLMAADDEYFPFTHGDNIERQRVQMREEMKADFLERQRAISSVARDRGDLSAQRRGADKS